MNFTKLIYILFGILERIVIKTDAINDTSLINSVIEYLKEHYNIALPIVVPIDNSLWTDKVVIYFITKEESLSYIKGNEIVFTINPNVVELYPNAILIPLKRN